MRFRSICAVSVSSILALAVSPLARADAPTTKPTAPATQPATKPSAKAFPNLADLVAAQKEQKDLIAGMKQVGMFEFDGPIVEAPAEFSFFGPSNVPTLRSVIKRLEKARDDDKLHAIFLHFGVGAGMNMAAATEIRDAIVDVKKAGKKIFVYADAYDSTTYTIASAATDICMLEAGEIMMPGIGLETMFYRGTMDKVGITPDFVQIGEFKGAEEPYMRTKPSDELRGELNKLVDSLFTYIVDGIATTRGLSRDTVRRAIDETMVTGPDAKERGFVDHLTDIDGIRELIEGKLDGEMNLVNDYGATAREEIDFSNIFSLLKAMNKREEDTTGPTIALIYAEGVISDGSGGGSLFEAGGVGSDPMREAFRAAVRDDNIKAIVVRIDSPGGSALASEVMWQAARRAAKEKPLIISIGGMAASGGYYLASAGDYIFADPSAIIGSIGVVGGKFVLKDLYEKIGLSTEEFSKGRNANLYSSNSTWNEQQRAMVKKSMTQVYEQFTQRVMTTRRGKIQDVDKVARGRIFLAGEAHKLGMVDELGGLEKALAYAADRSGLQKNKYEIKMLPAPRTLAEVLAGGGTDLRTPIKAAALSSDSLLLALPESARKSIARQLQLMKMLERRGVILLAPFEVKVK